MDSAELEKALRRVAERESAIHCDGEYNPSFCRGYVSALDRLHREGYLSPWRFINSVKYMDE